MPRRLAAVLSVALLLHANAWTVVRSCAAAEHTAGTEPVDHSQHTDHAPQKQQSSTDPACCDEMSVCASVLAFAAAGDVASGEARERTAIAPTDAAYRGILRAPDPPPPRHEAV